MSGRRGIVRSWPRCGATIASAVLVLPAAPALADKVELTSGDVLTGSIVEQNDTIVVLESETLGRLEISREHVASLTIDPPEGEPLEEAPKEEKPKEEAPPEKDWKLTVNFSFTSTSGNTETLNMRFGFAFDRKTPTTRLLYDLSYYLAVNAGTTTDNMFTTGIRHDWLFKDSRWFAFIAGRFDWNQFQSWEQRVNAQGGPGYHVITKDDFESVDMELDVFGGVGARQEFGSTNDDAKLEGVLGLEYRWFITEKMRLDFTFSYFPVLTDFGDYRTRTTFAWTYLIEQKLNLSLLAGMNLETQSIVSPGNETYDLRFFIGAQVAY